MRRRTIISTDNFDVPLRKRVTHLFQKVNLKELRKFGRATARFLNKQFALIVIAFFVLSLNVISAPVTVDTTINPLINYDPDAVVKTNGDIAPFVPIIRDAPKNELDDQVASAVIGPQTTYVPKPMLAETVDHKTADLIRRGLRREVVTHVVEQGETLSKIASDYGINTATLLRDNHLTFQNINKLKPGTKLAIASESSSDAVAWLDNLQQLEAKKAKVEKEKQTKLAAKNKNRANRLVATASAEDVGAGGSKFRLPIRGTWPCRNGYHLWAVDCGANIGTPVTAAAGGTVSTADDAGYNGGYGKTVVINHGNGWETRYAHLAKVEVNDGEYVKTGDEIALSGNTGHSTGPHLHFETHYNGQRFNPINLIR